MTYDLFISFADEDKDFALNLCSLLEKKSIKVWCSAKDVPIGADIHAEVSQALPQCRYFLPIISPVYGSRDWHQMEFHSAAHKTNKWIIPLAYQTDYEYIKNNPMFSLISSIRIVEANDTNMTQICENIVKRITGKSVLQKYISSKTILSPQLLHNKIVQIAVAISLFAFCCMRMYDYISAKEQDKVYQRQQQEITELTDSLLLVDKAIAKPTNGLQSVLHQDNFTLQIKDVTPQKQKDGLHKIYFTIKNKGNKSLFFNGLILEVTRMRGDIDFIEKNDDISTVGIWEAAIPDDTENAKYKYKISNPPKKLVGEGETVKLCLVLFQQEGGKKVLPKPFTMRATFLSSERTEVSSKEFLFDKKGEFVYDE